MGYELERMVHVPPDWNYYKIIEWGVVQESGCIKHNVLWTSYLMSDVSNDSNFQLPT